MAKHINTFPYWGGKLRKLNALYHHFPKDIGVFYDLFGGSGVVSANLPLETYKHRIYNDADAEVCNMLKLIKDEPERVSHERDLFLEYLEDKFKYDKDLIYRYNSKTVEAFKQEVERSGLNKQYIFNHLKSMGEMGRLFLQYIVFSGNLNAAQGDISIKDLGILKRKNFHEVSEKLQNLEIINCKFESFTPQTKSNKNFIYLDPPYTTNSNKYKNTDFAGGDLLQQSINFAKESNCRIAISCNQNDVEKIDVEGLNLVEIGSWIGKAKSNARKSYQQNTEYLITNYTL